MSILSATRSALEDALRPHGLHLRGGFVPIEADALPRLPGGDHAAVVWMVGQLGSSCWAAFGASPFAVDGLPDPMDRWAKSIAQVLANQWGGLGLFPSDGPPYRPFARWAERGEPLARGRIGMQLHPQVGMWHAYRFALALPVLAADDAAHIGRVDADPRPDPCARCAAQACLSTCPVGAFTRAGYDVPACAAHLHSRRGLDCMQRGCLARRACPVGREHLYEPAQAAFHMANFARKHPVSAGS